MEATSNSNRLDWTLHWVHVQRSFSGEQDYNVMGEVPTEDAAVLREHFKVSQMDSIMGTARLAVKFCTIEHPLSYHEFYLKCFAKTPWLQQEFMR